MSGNNEDQTLILADRRAARQRRKPLRAPVLILNVLRAKGSNAYEVPPR